MNNRTYFSVIPRDIYMLIVSNLLIDQIYKLYDLRSFSSNDSSDESFWDDLYFLKYHHRIPSQSNAKQIFDEQLNLYNKIMEIKDYASGLPEMSKMGMVNEIFEIIRLGDGILTQNDYLHAVRNATSRKHLDTVKLLFNSPFFPEKDNITSKDYAWILGIAAGVGDLNIFTNFFPIIVNQLTSDDYGKLLFSAAAGGNLKMIKKVIKSSQQSHRDISEYRYKSAHKVAEVRGNKEVAYYLSKYFS